MKDSLQALIFPFGGIDNSSAAEDQHQRVLPDGRRVPTTPSALNVRGNDPSSGRDRGGQRSGLEKYCPDLISGANVIQDINQITYGTTASGSASQGPEDSPAGFYGIPTVFSDDASVGTEAWSPTNALAASVPLGEAELSHYMLCDQAPFNIPALATIDAIRVRLFVSSDNGGNADGTIKLIKNGAVVGSNMGSANSWPVAGEWREYNPDISGLGLTPAILNAGGLGVAVSAVGAIGISTLGAAQLIAFYTVPGASGGDIENLASGRGLRSIAVSDGNVVRFSAAGRVDVGTGLSTTAKVIFSAAMFAQIYYADGETYFYYDAVTDSLLPLVASAGELPEDSEENKPRLVCAWRNRLVWSGLPLDANNWFMSAKDDPTDYDYAPVPVTETMACAGSDDNTEAGYNPDMVTCLLNYSNDVLIFGGDQSIWMMNGDPAQGGRFDLVTDGIGVSWGRPFCRDGNGNVYLFSNRGGIYHYQPGSQPVRISDPIAEDLFQVLPSQQLVRMAWDERQVGFHVWVTFLEAAAATFHYFYDAENKAWWKDQYGHIDFNPLAVHVHDGDSLGDRTLLIGSWDGYIRSVTEEATNDDGYAIASEVFMGPIKDKLGSGMTLADLQCALASGSGDVDYSIHAGETAQAALVAAARASGTFTAGRNRSKAVRVFGHSLFVKLSSSSLTRWALEYTRIRVRESEGRLRQRAF